jgi:hypothetical protein
MQFQKKVRDSMLISSAVLISSFILPIIPCRVAPAVPNPVYKWAMCNLNPELLSGNTPIKEYLGYSTSLTESYFSVLLITFIASMIFFHYATKTKKE